MSDKIEGVEEETIVAEIEVDAITNTVLSEEEVQAVMDEMNELGTDETEEGTPPEITIPHVTITSSAYDEILAFLHHYEMDTEGLSQDEVIAKYEKILEIKEQQVQVLSLGQTTDMLDRMRQYVPEGFKHQFFLDTPTDIMRAEGLGFELLYDEKAKRESSTGKADGLVRVGDLIMMTIPEEGYAALRIAKDERNIHKRNRRLKKQISGPDASVTDAQGGAPIEADPNFPLLPVAELGIGG